MVIRKAKGSMIYFIPECTCNKKLDRIVWKTGRFDSNENESNSWAEDHEELHELSHKIVNFIAETGKMMKEDILEGFPDYKEEQLSIAANLSMYPIIFPKRRRAPPAEFERLKKHARELTQQYRRAKYAPVIEEETPLVEE